MLVYHKVLPDGSTPGQYDITASQLQAQLAYISSAGLGSDVVTVKHALADIYPPTAGTVTIAPQSATTNTTLTATPSGFSNYVHSPLSYVYTWKVNGTVVPGETGATLDLSRAGYGDRGDTVSVEVSARDQWGNSSAAASAQVVVDNTAPTSGAVTITPSSPKADQTLTATPTAFADADGDTLTYQYTWKINGTVVPGETGATLDLSKAGHATHGDTVSVEVVARDPSGGQSPAASAQVVVDNTAPTSGAVTITPSSPKADQTLTATPTAFADADGDTLTYQYTWMINGTVVPGETGPTLDLSKAGHATHGDTVSVEVVARDPSGGQSPAASAQVAVDNTAPTSGAVTITPSSPTADQTLTATPTGFADADGDPLTYQYTWFHNGQPIAGATTATLPGSAVVAGETVSVQVVAKRRSRRTQLGGYERGQRLGDLRRRHRCAERHGREPHGAVLPARFDAARDVRLQRLLRALPAAPPRLDQWVARRAR